MANTKRSTGATGQTVASNLRRLRTEQNLTYAAVSQRLKDIGHQALPLSIRRMEEEQRAVDVDDLIALAAVYGVSPLSLLAPDAETGNAETTTTATKDTVPAWRLYGWMRGDNTLFPEGWRADGRFKFESTPKWEVPNFHLLMHPSEELYGPKEEQEPNNGDN